MPSLDQSMPFGLKGYCPTPKDTFIDALELLKHSRKASPRLLKA